MPGGPIAAWIEGADGNLRFQSGNASGGALFPTMTTTARDALAAPTAGMIIYNTTTNKLNVRVAAGWEAITSA